MKTNNRNSPPGLFIAKGTILLIAALTCLARANARELQVWDINGELMVNQDNGVTVKMHLKPSAVAENCFIGEAVQISAEAVQALSLVNGCINATTLTFFVQYPQRKKNYEGKIAPNGTVSGTAEWEDDPKDPSGKCNWQITRPLKRVAATGAADPPSSESTSTDTTVRTTKKSSRPTKSASATSVKIPHNKKHGNSWDGGKDHPNAEVWVKRQGGDEKQVAHGGQVFNSPAQATSSSSTETTESASTETLDQKKKHKKKHHHHHDEDEN